MTHRIMLVEDEMIVAMDVQQRLESLGYEVVALATSGAEAIQSAQTTRPHLILMDIKIQGEMDGIDTAAKIRETQNIPVIYVTAFSDDSTLKRARTTEAYGYLIKPFENRELRSAIEIALYKHELENKLRESEERYRMVVETSPDGIAVIDLGGRLIAVNRKAVEMWGFENAQEMVGLKVCELIAPEDHSRVAGDIAEMRDENKTFPREYRFLRKDGTFFYGEYSSAIICDASGKAVSIMAITRDITQRKMAEDAIRELNAELEQRVVTRTAALEVSNKELEAFAYSVAHDLRSPLRAIMGFSQALNEDYGKIIDPQGQDYLKRIQNATGNMSALIDGLLDLARFSRSEITREDVDVAKIARQITQKLHSTKPDRKVEFIIPERLIVSADLSLIQIVLVNLLDNAWKFSSRVPNARIELGAAVENGQAVVFVRDNGAGFNMAHVGKLFGTFQRLHSSAEFEGTGIGLSIVQRIIHRHGGYVWAESEMGKGSSFYFTLSPAA